MPQTTFGVVKKIKTKYGMKKKSVDMLTVVYVNSESFEAICYEFENLKPFDNYAEQKRNIECVWKINDDGSVHFNTLFVTW